MTDLYLFKLKYPLYRVPDHIRHFLDFAFGLVDMPEFMRYVSKCYVIVSNLAATWPVVEIESSSSLTDQSSVKKSFYKSWTVIFLVICWR